MDIKELQEKIRAFRDERDWMQFHDAKSMAASICIEAAELLEHFQWKNQEDISEYIRDHKDEVAEEVADIAMYLFEFADNAGIDLADSMQKKLKKNAAKYPVNKSKGSSKKYDQLS